MYVCIKWVVLFDSKIGVTIPLTELTYIQHCMPIHRIGMQESLPFSTDIWILTCKQSLLTNFYKLYDNQTHTTGGGMVWGTRIVKFKEIRHWMEESMTFLFILQCWILLLVCTQVLSMWFSSNIFGTWTCLNSLLETLHTHECFSLQGSDEWTSQKRHLVLFIIPAESLDKDSVWIKTLVKGHVTLNKGPSDKI